MRGICSGKLLIMPHESMQLRRQTAQKRTGLNSLFNGSRPCPGLGSLGSEVMDLAALRARCNLGILFGHFVQEVRKRLTTVVAQKINLLIVHICPHRYWMPRQPERKPRHLGTAVRTCAAP